MWRVLHAAIFGAPTPRAPIPAPSSVILKPCTAALNPAGKIRYVIATPTGDQAAACIPGTGRGFFLAVTSEPVHQDLLTEQWLKVRPDRETSVRLTAKPSNAGDPNAVAVQTFAGETLGYLPADEAARYQPLLVQLHTQGLIGICSAKFVGGTPRKKRLSVHLDIQSPAAVASALGLTYTHVENVAAAGVEPTRRAWAPGPHKDSVRLSALPIGDATYRDLGSGASFTLGIVGESYRQAALHALDAGRLQRGEHVTFTATLIPEALYDPNGIRVEIQGGAHVGYLSKQDAVWYRPVFATLAAQQLVGVVRAKLIGGVLPDKPSIGVMLDIHEPTELLRILATDGQPF
jgi:hypothetical protein